MKLVWMLAQISTPNQIRSMPSFSAAGASSGMMMKAISKKSRKNATMKMNTLTKIRKPTCPPGSEVSRCSIHSAADALEHQAEHARADQDVGHHRGDAHGRGHALIEQRPGQRAVHGRKRDRANHAHRAGFRRRREAHEDRAEHQEDQAERRDHAAHALLPQRPAVQRARFLRQRRHSCGQMMLTIATHAQNSATCIRLGPRRPRTCRRPSGPAGRRARPAPATAG